MNNYMEEINKMTEGTLNIIKEMVKKCSKCDQTITAQITQVLSADKVKVKYNDSERTAYTNIACEIGDMVRVTFPCGNLEDAFVTECKGKGRTLKDIYNKIAENISHLNDLKLSFNKSLEYSALDRIKNAQCYKTICVNGDSDTYYPVAITCNQTDNIFPVFLGVGKHLGSKTASYSGNHKNGTSSMSYWWVMRQGGWDGNCPMLRTLQAVQPYASLIAKCEMNGSSYSGVVLWLRGGGTTYNICVSDTIRICQIYYSTTNLGTSAYPYNVSPTSEIGNKGVISYGVGLTGTVFNL